MSEDFNVTQLPPDLVAEGQLPMAPSALAQLQEPVAQAQQPQALDQPPDQGTPSRGEMMQQPAQPPPRVPGTSSLGSYQGTKGQIFRNMLGDFLYATSKGLSEAGHGPGANARGAGVAGTALYERGIEQQQMAMRQQVADSQEAIRKQQAEYITPSVNMVGPDGETHMIAPKDVPSALGAQYKFAGQMGAAAVGANARTTAATTAAEASKEVARIKEGAQSAFGKLTPEMAAVGMPPDPKDFPLGKKDPQFNKAVQAYGSAVGAIKQKNELQKAMTRGESFAYGRAKYMQVPVLDSDTQEMKFNTPLEIAASNGRLKPLAEADKMMMKNAMFEDINGAAGNLRKAIQANPQGFTAPQIAKMTAAMDSDPSGGLLHSVTTNLIQAGGKDALSPAQQNVAIAMQQAYENAYALRGVAGMGQGSDELRRAIRNTLPGPSSPQGYALKQLTAFEQQVNRLHRGVPNMPLRNAGDTGAPTTKTGPLTIDEAVEYLKAAGGNKSKAIAAAKADGRTF